MMYQMAFGLTSVLVKNQASPCLLWLLLLGTVFVSVAVV